MNFILSMSLDFAKYMYNVTHILPSNHQMAIVE